LPPPTLPRLFFSAEQRCTLPEQRCTLPEQQCQSLCFALANAAPSFFLGGAALHFARATMPIAVVYAYPIVSVIRSMKLTILGILTRKGHKTTASCIWHTQETMVSIVNYEIEWKGKNVRELVHESADENATYVCLLIQVDPSKISRVTFVTTLCDGQQPQVCLGGVGSLLYVFVNKLHHCYADIVIDQGNYVARVNWCAFTHADLRDQAIIAIRSLIQFKILAQGQNVKEVHGACSFLYECPDSWTPETSRILLNTMYFQICNKMEHKKLRTGKTDQQSQDCKLEHMSRLQSQMSEAMPQKVVNACLERFCQVNKRQKRAEGSDAHENKLQMVIHECEIVVRGQIPKQLEEVQDYCSDYATPGECMIFIIEYRQDTAQPDMFQIGTHRAVIFPNNVLFFSCSEESEVCFAQVSDPEYDKVKKVSVGGLRNTLHSLLSNLLTSKRDLTDYPNINEDETATKLVNHAAHLWSDDFKIDLFRIAWAQQLSDYSDEEGWARVPCSNTTLARRLAQNAVHELYTLQLLNTHLHSLASQ
jgi:hypothetical protein